MNLSNILGRLRASDLYKLRDRNCTIQVELRMGSTI